MYVAKINEKGRASYVHMFDEQLFELDDLLIKSYYMTSSSDRETVAEYCDNWNAENRDVISKNTVIYYLNVIVKGILQAPALIVLYSCIVMGVILLFGSELFYEQIELYGVTAFGTVRNAVIITYVVSAVVGLIASLTTYNNILYKVVRSVSSIAAFILISPVFYEKVFYSNSNRILTMTIICIVGCFFVRILIDKLLTGVVRKRTEQLIRAAHNCASSEKADVAAVNETENISLQPIIEKIRREKKLKQYKKR